MIGQICLFDGIQTGGHIFRAHINAAQAAIPPQCAQHRLIGQVIALKALRKREPVAANAHLVHVIKKAFDAHAV